MNPILPNAYIDILLNKSMRKIDNRLLDFRSHKQRVFQTIENSQQYEYKCEMQFKKLIHEWLDYQNKINTHQPSLGISKLFLSRNNNSGKQAQQILIEKNNMQQSNLQLENNHFSVQLIQKLAQNHSIFKKINFNLTETLINIGVFSLYKKNQTIPYIFYNQKQKNHCNENKRLGFIIYGKLKLFDKINNYQKIINKSQTIGQHRLQSLGIKFTDYRDVKVKSQADQTAILWIEKSHYQILSKESMKCGLKEQLRKLQSFLKISWIQKKTKRF